MPVKFFIIFTWWMSNSSLGQVIAKGSIHTAMERAVCFDLMLHAMMFLQTGIPMVYSGDELAQVNDYSYGIASRIPMVTA